MGTFISYEMGQGQQTWKGGGVKQRMINMFLANHGEGSIICIAFRCQSYLPATYPIIKECSPIYWVLSIWLGWVIAQADFHTRGSNIFRLLREGHLALFAVCKNSYKRKQIGKTILSSPSIIYDWSSSVLYIPPMLAHINVWT